MYFGPVDEIYHLASIASPKFYMKYPLQTLMLVILELKYARDSKEVFCQVSIYINI